MKKMLKRRSGFTLVELLIVIIIIGILAGAMLMLVGSGTDRAEATKIISDLRSLKAAALMWYADNPNGKPDDVDAFKDYMDKSNLSGQGYLFGTTSGDTAWVVGYGQITKDGIKTALAGSKNTVGLYGTTDSNAPTSLPTSPDYGNQGWVWMRAR